MCSILRLALLIALYWHCGRCGQSKKRKSNYDNDNISRKRPLSYVRTAMNNDGSDSHDLKTLMIVLDSECLEERNSNSFTISQMLKETYQCIRANTDKHSMQRSRAAENDFDIIYFSILNEHCFEQTLDWNTYCISQITYEPLFKINDDSDDDEMASIIETFDDGIAVAGDGDGSDMWIPDDIESGFECALQDVSEDFLPYKYAWGNDLSDSDVDSYFNRLYIHDSADEREVDIFVLDTGILTTHDEFANGPAVIQLDPDYANITKDHGTGVAAVIAGHNYGVTNGFTIYNYNVCRYINSAGTTYCRYRDILVGLQSVRDTVQNTGRRAVINLSFSGGSTTYFDAVFQELYDLDAIMVCSAGNSDADSCNYSPPLSAYTITVGAYEQDELSRITGTNYGSCVDLYAPGRKVPTASSEGDNMYFTKSGTSFSTPLVAGMVANMLYLNPELSYDEIKSLLIDDELPRATVSNCNNDVNDTDADCYATFFPCEEMVDMITATLPAPTSTPTPQPTQLPTKSPTKDASIKCCYGRISMCNTDDKDECLGQNGYCRWNSRCDALIEESDIDSTTDASENEQPSSNNSNSGMETVSDSDSDEAATDELTTDEGSVSGSQMISDELMITDDSIPSATQQYH